MRLTRVEPTGAPAAHETPRLPSSSANDRSPQIPKASARVKDRQSYLDHALDAERLARRSLTPEERAAYERIAAVWRDLAGPEPTKSLEGSFSEDRDAGSAPPRPGRARSR